jgi:pimeloyl-ACP methyl ester carboxylesterase
VLNHVVIGDGHHVMIFHGGKLDHRHMVDAIEPVFHGIDGWKRIYVDLPGHGRSAADASYRSQDDVLAAVTKFAATQFPGQTFALIGESRGSYTAQGFAYAHPELTDGLLLIVPGGNTEASRGKLPEHRTIVSDQLLRSELTDDELARFDRLVVQNRSIIEKIRRTKIPAIPLHDREMEERIGNYFEFSFDLGGPDAVFDRPSLIISGRQDAIAGYADAIESLPTYPRATYALMDTAGHSLAWERPDLFKALARDWLQRLSLELSE